MYPFIPLSMYLLVCTEIDVEIEVDQYIVNRCTYIDTERYGEIYVIIDTHILIDIDRERNTQLCA